MVRLGLIGFPLDHTFSQSYFEAKFRKEGIEDIAYSLFPIENPTQLRNLVGQHPELKGLNVTIPHKEAVIPFLDELSPLAGQTGAVNTIIISRNNGKAHLKGYNTDIHGFTESIGPLLTPDQKNALILGTGGAAKAVASAFIQLKINFKWVSRSREKGDLSYKDIDKHILEQHKILVNCTPLGMQGCENEKPPLPYSSIGERHLLYDLIYNPPETAFLREGRIRCARTKNGLEMLQLQAERSWEIWDV